MAIWNFLANDEWLNAFRLTPDRMRAFLKKLDRRPPKLIVAYAQSIYELAQFAERDGIAVMPQAAVMTSAGTLHDFMRAAIERTFRCDVFSDKYGSREVGNIASECRHHHGLHVFPWSNYVEILDDNGLPSPIGEVGRIVVTCLTNFAMPLIRYDIGDRGLFGLEDECPCGRKGQIIPKIMGRNVDTFIAQNGTLVDGEYFTHLLTIESGFSSFK